MRFPLIWIWFLALTMKGQDIITIAGNGVAGYAGDNGPATAASMDNQYQIATDRKGNLYIADRNNNCIRKVDAFGIITTIAGTGTAGFGGDNGPAVNALLYLPCAVATDTLGNIYIGDALNHRIRKIDSSGKITTVAGTGFTAFNGDGISATSSNLNTPLGIAVDNKGNIFVSDIGNFRIRKIDTAGIITTVTGTGTAGFSGDNGPAILAMVDQVIGITLDNQGNIYFSDSNNNRIRRIDTAGTITTIAGTGGSGYGGDGGPAISAQIQYPSQIAIDSWRNIYITCGYGYTVRKLTPSGQIISVAGTGSPGFSGDNGPAVNAQLNGPIGVAVDTSGNLYISDALNHRIRKVDNSVSVKHLPKKNFGLELFPNPTDNSFYITGYDVNVTSLPVEITDVTGKLIFKAELLNKNGIAEVSYDFPKGIFFVIVENAGLKVTKKIVINK